MFALLIWSMLTWRVVLVTQLVVGKPHVQRDSGEMDLML